MTTHVADIDFDTLAAIAADAYGKAADEALAAGLVVTGLVEGCLMQAYPDGAVVPAGDACAPPSPPHQPPVSEVAGHTASGVAVA